MQIKKLNRKFGREAKKLMDQTKDNNADGAIACLETFYYAFNNRDMDTFQKVWLNHELIQLNNPLGGIMRGIIPIVDLYNKIFTGQARVWVEFSDIVSYQSADMIAFSGRETGEFKINDQAIDLQIRTTRLFGYSENEKQWFQIHHHGSIDNAGLLDKYQKAVKMQ